MHWSYPDLMATPQDVYDELIEMVLEGKFGGPDLEE
jgi:hypothetical protein